MSEQNPTELPIPGGTTRFMTSVYTLGLGIGSEVISDTADQYGLIDRNALPEPWDVPDHIGNFTEGSAFTVGAYVSYAIVARKLLGYESTRSRAIVGAGAFATSAAVQILGELYVSSGNSRDTIDAAYGTAFAGVATMALIIGYGKAAVNDATFPATTAPRKDDRLGIRTYISGVNKYTPPKEYRSSNAHQPKTHYRVRRPNSNS